MGVAYEAGVFAADEILLPAVGEPAEGGFEERHLDASALSGRAAPAEGGQYGVGREQAAHYVRDRDAHLRRLPAGLARNTHDAAPRLHQEVVAGTVLVRARPEARDGAVDEIGVLLPQSFVAEAELFECATPPVFDQNVGLCRERLDPLQPYFVLEVDPDRTLVAVDGEEVGRLAAGERWAPVAGGVSPLLVVRPHNAPAAVATPTR